MSVLSIPSTSRLFLGLAIVASCLVAGCGEPPRTSAPSVDSPQSSPQVATGEASDEPDEPENVASSAGTTMEGQAESESAGDATAEENATGNADSRSQSDADPGSSADTPSPADPGATEEASSEAAPAPPDAATLKARASQPVVEITFEDLKLEMGPDEKFSRSLLTDRVKELEGHRVRLPGFMYPSFQATGITQFVLLKNTQCPFGPGGTASHCVWVEMAEGKDTDYPGNKPLVVEGILSVQPYDGPGPDGKEVSYSAYHIKADRVKN